MIWREWEAKYICEGDWTTQIRLNLLGKFRFTRTADGTTNLYSCRGPLRRLGVKCPHTLGCTCCYMLIPNSPVRTRCRYLSAFWKRSWRSKLNPSTSPPMPIKSRLSRRHLSLGGYPRCFTTVLHCPSHRRSLNTLTKPSPAHVYTLPTRVVGQGRGKYRPGFGATSCRLEMSDRRSSCFMEQKGHRCPRLHVIGRKAVFRRKRLARGSIWQPIRRLVYSGRRSGNDAEPAHRPR